VFCDTEFIAMPSPLHLKISKELHRQMLQGNYPPGTKLPSEHQLMANFNVSRITVRQAIANLASQGLVTAQQGKGVFVNEQQKIAHSLSSPLLFVADDMAQRGIDFSMQNLLFEAIVAPNHVRSALQLSTRQSKVYTQQKLFLMNGTVGAIDASYIPLNLGKLYGAVLEHGMTFPTLEAHGVSIQRVEALLECTHADSEISAHLNVPLGHPLMVYRYTAYTCHDRAIVHGETISRADRFCYTVTVLKESAYS
jgi:GntR family transcriptional regulator